MRSGLTYTAFLVLTLSIQAKAQLSLNASLIQDIWISESIGSTKTNSYTYVQHPILGHYDYSLKPRNGRGNYDPSEAFLPCLKISAQYGNWNASNRAVFALETSISGPHRVHNREFFRLEANILDPQTGLAPDPNAHPTAQGIWYGWAIGVGQKVWLKLLNKNDKRTGSRFSLGIVYLNRSLINYDQPFDQWVEDPFGSRLLAPSPNNNANAEISVNSSVRNRKHGIAACFGYHYEFEWFSSTYTSTISIEYLKGFLPLLEGKYEIKVNEETDTFYSHSNGSSIQVGLGFPIYRLRRKSITATDPREGF